MFDECYGNSVVAERLLEVVLVGRAVLPRNKLTQGWHRLLSQSHLALPYMFQRPV